MPSPCVSVHFQTFPARKRHLKISGPARTEPTGKCAPFPHFMHTFPHISIHTTQTYRKVCTVPAFHAHFPHIFPSRTHKPTGKCAPFPRSMHTFPHISIHTTQVCRKVCTIPAFHAHFPPYFHPYHASLPESVHHSRISCTLSPHISIHTTQAHRKVCTVPAVHAHFPSYFHPYHASLPESVHRSRISCTLSPHISIHTTKACRKVCTVPAFHVHSPPHISIHTTQAHRKVCTVPAVHAHFPRPRKRLPKRPLLCDGAMHATACTIPQRAGGEPPLRDVTSERQRERPGPGRRLKDERPPDSAASGSRVPLTGGARKGGGWEARRPTRDSALADAATFTYEKTPTRMSQGLVCKSGSYLLSHLVGQYHRRW